MKNKGAGRERENRREVCLVVPTYIPTSLLVRIGSRAERSPGRPLRRITKPGDRSGQNPKKG